MTDPFLLAGASDPGPAWWTAAVAGECSHGGHGWDGDTCDDASDPTAVDLDTRAIDAARTADDLLTALFNVPVDMREYALAGRGVRILRAAADLCGVSYADTLSKRAAIRAIVDNF